MKKTIIIMFLLLMAIPLVFAQEASVCADYNSIRDLFINEEIRTRTELKTYIDDKVTIMTNDFEERGRSFVDEQITSIEERTKNLFNILLLKLLLGVIVSMILGNAIWYIIYRGLLKIKMKRKQIIRNVEEGY